MVADLPERLLDAGGEPIAGAPLGALLTAQAARVPSAPALTVDGKTVSMAELERAANGRARWFSRMGVGKEGTVLIALPNGPVFYESVLACWKLGAVPAPVSHHLTDSEFTAICALGAPALIVSDRGISGAGCPVVSGSERPPKDLPDAALAPVAALSWKMATTGGSTGQPKLVVDAAPGKWGPEKIALGRRSGMTVINPAPLYHAAPFGLIIPAILQGCHVIDMGGFDAERWLSLVDRHRIAWAYMVPTMMARIARLPEEARDAYDLTCLKTLLHLAAPCPEWVKRFWIDWIGADAVWEIYGGAERLGSTLIGGAEWLEHPGSVGRPSTGTLVEIRDHAGNALPPGQVGEIHLRRERPGSHLQTRDGCIPQGGDWASFGDLGRLDEDGYLYIVDRRTDMIVSGGVNLYPSEIEAALGSHPKVIDAVVVGLPDADLGKRAHAIVQCAPGEIGNITVDEMLAHLGGLLARPKHPRSFEFTTLNLRDDAGKVRRAAWRDEINARDAQRASDGC